MISLANLGFPSLTPLSSFNSWALSMAAWRSGEMEGEALAREFSRFQLEMSQISAVFRSEIRFQEAHGPLQSLIETALQRLAVCEDQADVLKEWEGDWEGISEKRVQGLGAALNSLFEVFGQIRELEEERPRLAASPYIHEILRCLQLYERGVLAPELMQERLAGVSQHFQLLGEQMRQSPVRLAAVEQLLDLLEVQENALQQLSEQITEGQPPGAESKRVLHDCAQQALTIHEEIQALAGTPAVWCDGCLGLVRLTDEQQCPECGQPVGAPEESGDGLLAVAERACAENRREDWELLQVLSQESEAQAQEMVKKVKQLPLKQPDLEAALLQLAGTVAEIRDYLPGRDAPGLERLLPRLRQDLESAAEMQQQVLEEIKGR
ncbi:MAG: hypothetical protein KF760_28125 [Candidatus Eremiobacteraeota bacterium]|nr:hypothetical protein [Candidatus Eremiobacteraeota bacterium]MCW5872500.1 hypothetical protein [Candidatus Eremiobacteraeota bacterium]